MFIPFVKREEESVFDLEQLITDVDNLRKGVFVRHIQIQGGEPLLYKDLDKLIIYLITSKITPRVSIATNSTLLLNDDQLKLFREYSVKVRLSDYGLEHQKIEQIEEQCRTNNIPHKVHRQVTKDKTWLDMGGSRHEDDLEVKKIFEACLKYDCYTLIDGKFTRCTRSLMGSLVGLYPDLPNDYIDLRKTDYIVEDLRNFLLDERFMDCCRYCNGSTGKKIPAGVQLDKHARRELTVSRQPSLDRLVR
jgi:hypothetical protein